MPASVGPEKQPSARLLPVLFWVGVGLAPLAAALLIVGQGQAALRIAAVLAILAFVLIGLSITFRKDGRAVRADVEDTFFDEMDLLREDLRNDIGNAARATHRQFAEKLQALYESVESLRAQANGRYEPAQVPAGQVAAALADPHAAPQLPPAVAHAPAPPPREVGFGQVGFGQVGQPDHGQAGYGHGSVYVGTAGVPSPPVVGGGVVRHTETVQVTTRHTVVDPHRDGQGRGTVYGGNAYGGNAYGGNAYGGTAYGGTAYGGTAYGEGTAYAEGNARGGTAYGGGIGYGRDEPGDGWRPGREWAEPAEESWTEQRLRERLGGQRGADHRDADSRDGRRHRAHERDDDEPDSDERRSDASAGDDWSARWGRGGAGTVANRWASVRSDEHGRELRMGERRTAMHSDESGTELRIEDRWASVRREEPRWWDSPERWSEDRWGPEVEDTGRWGERGGQAALPAGGTEPSWGQGSEAGWSSELGRASEVGRSSGAGRGSETSRSRVEAGRAGQRRYREDDSDDGYGWQAEPWTSSPSRTRQRVPDYEADVSDDRRR